MKSVQFLSEEMKLDKMWPCSCGQRQVMYYCSLEQPCQQNGVKQMFYCGDICMDNHDHKSIPISRASAELGAKWTKLLDKIENVYAITKPKYERLSGLISFCEEANLHIPHNLRYYGTQSYSKDFSKLDLLYQELIIDQKCKLNSLINEYKLHKLLELESRRFEAQEEIQYLEYLTNLNEEDVYKRYQAAFVKYSSQCYSEYSQETLQLLIKFKERALREQKSGHENDEPQKTLLQPSQEDKTQMNFDITLLSRQEHQNLLKQHQDQINKLTQTVQKQAKLIDKLIKIIGIQDDGEQQQEQQENHHAQSIYDEIQNLKQECKEGKKRDDSIQNIVDLNEQKVMTQTIDIQNLKTQSEINMDMNDIFAKYCLAKEEVDKEDIAMYIDLRNILGRQYQQQHQQPQNILENSVNQQQNSFALEQKYSSQQVSQQQNIFNQNQNPVGQQQTPFELHSIGKQFQENYQQFKLKRSAQLPQVQLQPEREGSLVSKEEIEKREYIEKTEALLSVQKKNTMLTLLEMGFTDFQKNDQLYDKFNGDVIKIADELSQ